MQKLVSITSQGQITIPALFRRLIGLNKYNNALVKTKNNKIIIEPIPDLLSLGGALKSKAIKNKSMQEIIELEEKSIIKHYNKSK